MITFQKLRWKNFLSTGNNFTEIDFTRNPTTLIVGENGSGKSTCLDALCFGLFNKPFRNINKPQLVNSINGKKMVVEIEFVVGQKQYKVIRGMKPNVFEIYCNDEFLDQDAALRDTQKYLEESILKLNYKSFTQIVILGSASFTPFMQLPSAARREIIEDILDIQIFTTMNVLLKEKMNILKEDIRIIDGEVELAKHKTKVQKEYIDTLESDKSKKLQNLEEQIDALTKDIDTSQQELEQQQEKKLELGDPKGDQRELDSHKKQFQSYIQQAEKELEFYENNSECPTCKQGIPHEHKRQTQERKSEEIGDLSKALKGIDKKYAEVLETLGVYSELSDSINQLQTELLSQERYRNTLRSDLTSAKENTGNIDEETKKLKSMAKDVLAKNDIKASKNEEQHYNTAVSHLLKDSGIKTRIIKQYLPAINKLVNKYLQSMDFFVHFELDEKFNETIKSRHRDKFSYASFSEGEKQRIDLALLFTWRTIAKMKNSASTNLLILDEVFDSSLDNNGTDYVMQLLNTIGDQTNVFVISHKGDQLFDKFRSQIKFEKIQNYSVMS
jgi:DNA repair exonuclease SbcCD ATPase subunit